jgi:RiboL-PSP-HEPN
VAGVRKPTPMEAFSLNMADAHKLVRVAEGFVNKRPRRMRAELQQRLGEALRIRTQDRKQLDCLESSDVFLTFLPGSRLHRDDFADLSPLLRQAIVAACAATETYLADKVMEQIGPVLRKSTEIPKRLGALQLTVDDWLFIDENYTYQRRGLREVVIEPTVRELSSAASSKVGELLSMLGVTQWTRKLDAERGVKKGDTEQTLERVRNRRNRIAHEGDRRGRSRAPISVDEVKSDLASLESIVAAIEAILPRAPRATRD